MDIITLLAPLSNWPTGFWPNILGWFNKGIGNLGWTIVIFTIALKLILMPLDIWQRRVSAVTSEKQMEMQPELDKINKQYANDKNMLNQKTMEVYQSHNFNIMSSCLGLLVNLILTFVIFITLWNGLQTISRFKIGYEYQELRKEYFIQIDQGKSEEEAQEIVLRTYDESLKEDFLWIKNIYLPDTSANAFPTFKEFVSKSGITFDNAPWDEDGTLYGTSENTEQERTSAFESEYNLVTKKIQEKYSHEWNGYYIIVILAGLVTYLSSRLTSKNQPQQTQKITLSDGTVMEQPINSMGFLNLMLPIMMVIFTLSYSGAFAIYIVVNSTMSLVINASYMQMRKISKKKKENKVEKNVNPYAIGKYTIIPKTEEEIKEEEARQKAELKRQKELIKEQKKLEKENKKLQGDKHDN